MNNEKTVSYLVDSNIIIYLSKGNERLIRMLDGNDQFYSHITTIEVLGFGKLSDSERRRYKGLLEDMILVEIHNPIVEIAIDLKCKYPKLQLPDSLVLASGIYRDLPILTADNDLKWITEANVILFKPWPNS